jgi:hypothetical protein
VRPKADPARPHPSRPWEKYRQPIVPVGRVWPKADPAGKVSPKADAARKEASWWTARATAGEVKPGFTKEEILRKPEADPRAAGGMFSRLEGLLRALS